MSTLSPRLRALAIHPAVALQMAKSATATPPVKKESAPPALLPSTLPALPLSFPAVIERRGEDYLVRAGKPQAWLTPKQFGVIFGLGPEAIRRKIGTEALPEELVEYNGPRRIRIRADAVDHFRTHWRTRRAAGG